MSQISEFLRVSDAYREFRGISEARVSTLVFGAGHSIKRIRAGGDVGVRRIAEAFRWLSVNWPAELEWPSDIPRPSPLSDPEGIAA